MSEDDELAAPSAWEMCRWCHGLGMEQSIDYWGYREDDCDGCHGWGYVRLRDERGRFVAAPSVSAGPSL